MPRFTVKYFDARGRAEPTRMLLSLAKVDFADDRFTNEEWAKIKDDKKLFPLGQAPVLIVDGKTIPHSRAMARFVALEYDLCGKTNAEKAHVDVVLETGSEIEQKLRPIFTEQDPEKKVEAVKAFKEGIVRQMKYFVELLKENGGKYFVGQGPTLADAMTFNFLDILTTGKYKVDGLLDPYPELQEYVRHFREESPLKSYFASRPQTDS